MPDELFVVRNETYLDPQVRSEKLATAGGQGSFSYLDTKVYGPRQQRQLYVVRAVGWSGSVDGDEPRYDQQVEGAPKFLIPGTGGSAKAPGRRYFGSRAIGFNPNGLVLIRLIKI